jgi:ABC-type polysaccharide/polyol phosphate export permease
MTHVLVAYQDLLFYGVMPPWKGLVGAVIFGVIAFALGAFVFDRLRDTLPEEV